jgi:integrin alpha FG-GAP repeat containing protein 1
LPYAYSGLGRTNNYLEEFTVGYQSYGQKEDWSPIIPNSQLMVYKEKGSWKLETLLKNNERVNDVIYVSIMILLFMGFVIIYLGNKEAQEDKRDHYNFIQLIR